MDLLLVCEAAASDKALSKLRSVSFESPIIRAPLLSNLLRGFLCQIFQFHVLKV